MSRQWWRRNRWPLVVLPIALGLMVLGSSYRVRTFWWDNGFHHETAHARAGQSVRVVNHFRDGVGDTHRVFRVRVRDIEPVDEVARGIGEDPEPLPSGVAAYRVVLEFEADPREDMNYCRVWLVGSDGTRYGGDETDPLGQVNRCVPEGHPGPASPLLKGERRGVVQPGEERPRHWTAEPVVLAAKGAHLRTVRLGFSWPEYVTLDLPR